MRKAVPETLNFNFTQKINPRTSLKLKPGEPTAFNEHIWSLIVKLCRKGGGG